MVAAEGGNRQQVLRDSSTRGRNWPAGAAQSAEGATHGYAFHLLVGRWSRHEHEVLETSNSGVAADGVVAAISRISYALVRYNVYIDLNSARWAG